MQTAPMRQNAHCCAAHCHMARNLFNCHQVRLVIGMNSSRYSKRRNVSLRDRDTSEMRGPDRVSSTVRPAHHEKNAWQFGPAIVG